MKDIFCTAPWTSLFIETNGEVKACCASKIPYGNINTISLDKIINNPIHTSLKQSLMNQQPHTNCDYCYKMEELSSHSTRKWFNEFTPVEVKNIEQFELQMIDVRWSNHCNLRCVYCRPMNSSKIAEFLGIKEKLSNRVWQNEILELVKDNILTIKEVYMLGGEPLLIKENSQLLDLLTDQHITVITNLSLDNSKNEIYKKLLTKPNVNWEISLEQTGKKFEFVRNNASWDMVLRNIRELNILDKRYSFAMQYCIYSAVDLYSILKEVQPMGSVVINSLITPECMNVENHCADIKQLALAELDRVFADEELINYLKELNVNKLKEIYQNLNTNNGMNKSKEFIKYQDKNPGPSNFEELWPTAWQIIQENQ
jgi:MoaA/NifB/PqqE/SkfB family radical SAM enzyme